MPARSNTSLIASRSALTRRVSSSCSGSSLCSSARLDTGSPGLLTRLYRWATGDAPANGLADPRLEAIRSFVDRARRYRKIDARLVEPLFRQGFNARQVDALALLALLAV